MIPRYADDFMSEIFSEEWTLNQWRHTELDFLVGRQRFKPEEVTREAVSEATAVLAPPPEVVEVHEVSTGHDVVAFLTAWTAKMSPHTASKIHYGLTSSDLVDNSLYRQLMLSGRHIYGLADALETVVQSFAFHHRELTRAGRTHGQLAEVTTLGWRFGVWAETLAELRDEWDTFLEQHVNVMKTPGAVGDMQILGKDVAQFVAEYRHQRLVASTQVIPRQRMMAWAGWCIRLVSVVEEIALEIRLSSRSEVGEMREHGTINRVGSSAMPHKRNPIGSEQLSGLARVARSHFAAIAETAGALHHERDISNSSVERLAVPDLAHITAYSLGKITQILNTLVVNGEAMYRHARLTPTSARMLAELQISGVPYVEALDQVRKLK